MTYCLAIRVDEGLIFASDSRTHAGADHVSTFSKMHAFEQPGERVICLLSAGNLATTQAVLRNIRRDNERGKGPRLDAVKDLAEAAEYVGQLSRNEQRKHGSKNSDKFTPEASFILGGQIAGRQHQIYLIYPEGNFISATTQTPYLQIGELKYGKPILDRIVREDISLEVAARCALVSMDSTMRSNATVGPPVELMIYPAGALSFSGRHVLQADNTYLRTLCQAWQQGLEEAFEKLPSLPIKRPEVKLVDTRADQ